MLFSTLTIISSKKLPLQAALSTYFVIVNLCCIDLKISYCIIKCVKSYVHVCQDDTYDLTTKLTEVKILCFPLGDLKPR